MEIGSNHLRRESLSQEKYLNLNYIISEPMSILENFGNSSLEACRNIVTHHIFVFFYWIMEIEVNFELHYAWHLIFDGKTSEWPRSQNVSPIDISALSLFKCFKRLQQLLKKMCLIAFIEDGYHSQNVTNN